MVTVASRILMHMASEQVAKYLIKLNILDCLGSPIRNAVSLLTLAHKTSGNFCQLQQPGLPLFMLWLPGHPLLLCEQQGKKGKACFLELLAVSLEHVPLSR